MTAPGKSHKREQAIAALLEAARRAAEPGAFNGLLSKVEPAGSFVETSYAEVRARERHDRARRTRDVKRVGQEHRNEGGQTCNRDALAETATLDEAERRDEEGDPGGADHDQTAKNISEIVRPCNHP